MEQVKGEILHPAIDAEGFSFSEPEMRYTSVLAGWWDAAMHAQETLKGALRSEDSATRRSRLQAAVHAIKIALDLLPE